MAKFTFSFEIEHAVPVYAFENRDRAIFLSNLGIEGGSGIQKDARANLIPVLSDKEAVDRLQSKRRVGMNAHPTI